MPKPSATFRFVGHDLNTAAGTAHFYFEIKRGSKTYRFIETLRFPTKGIAWRTIPPELLTKILDALALALGISYWKLYCPKNIEIAFTSLTKAQAAFWNTVYTKGLGEFYYKNKIDFRGLVDFPYDRSHTPGLPRPATALGARNDGQLKNRSLLQLGGGKDSIVSAELLKEAKKPFALFMLNGSPVQRSVAKLIGAPAITITRELDSLLFELNKRRDTFNGHVPISAIYACTGLLAATLYDYNSVIASNEASADYGNVRWLGQEINHQWSKSLEFEKLFQGYVERFITPDIAYFSLLRPFNEIEITEMFVQYPKYFSIFSSCNKNFKISSMPPRKKWCGKCPKCAFTFAALAAFLPKSAVLKIFQNNLFADRTLPGTYRELLGLKDSKPFECVGTPEETQLAFALASERGEYRDDPAMKIFESAFNRETVFMQKDAEKMCALDTIPEEFNPVIQETRSLMSSPT